MVGWGQHNPGIDLSSLGMPGCHQYASADVAVLFLPIGGSGSHTLSIPPMAALIGAHAYSQGLAFVPGVNPLGAITSNGVDLRFGTQ